MDRTDKTKAIDSMVGQLGRAKAAFLVDFKGLNVEEVTRLRKKLSSINSEMKVVRNTLARRALKTDQAKESALKDHLVGTNAFIFAYDDVSASAKALADFAKDVDKLQLKVGVMDGALLDKAKIKMLATLPSKDVLRAQLLGLFASPMTKFVCTLSAVPSGFVRVLGSQKTKLESNA